MPDMLVSLVRLPPIEPILEKLRGEGITIRRPNPWEQGALRNFIASEFSEGWADETSVAFSHRPVTCFVAMEGERIVGFAAYECTRRGYFGPTGVAEGYRGRGIGKALFLACLRGLQDLGYTYAIVGGAGPVGFYRKVAGAMVIPMDGGRGIYGLEEDPKFLSSPPPELPGPSVVGEEEVAWEEHPDRRSRDLVSGLWGFSLGVAEYTSEEFGERQTHEDQEVLYVVSGSGELLLGGQVRKVGPGTAVYVPPGVEHAIRRTGQEPVKVVYAHGSA